MSGAILRQNQFWDLTAMVSSGVWTDTAIDMLSRHTDVSGERLLALIGGASLMRAWHPQEWWRFLELTLIWGDGYRIDAIAHLDWRNRKTRWKEGQRPRLRRSSRRAPELLPYDPLDGHMSNRFGGVDRLPEETIFEQRKR